MSRHKLDRGKDEDDGPRTLVLSDSDSDGDEHQQPVLPSPRGPQRTTAQMSATAANAADHRHHQQQRNLGGTTNATQGQQQQQHPQSRSYDIIIDESEHSSYNNDSDSTAMPARPARPLSSSRTTPRTPVSARRAQQAKHTPIPMLAREFARSTPRQSVTLEKAKPIPQKQKKIRVYIREISILDCHLPPTALGERPFPLPIEFKLSLAPDDPHPSRRLKRIQFQRRFDQDTTSPASSSGSRLVKIVPTHRRLDHAMFEKRRAHSIVQLSIKVAEANYVFDLVNRTTDQWTTTSEYPGEIACESSAEVDPGNPRSERVVVGWDAVDLHPGSKPEPTDEQLAQRLDKELLDAHRQLGIEIAERHRLMAKFDGMAIHSKIRVGPDYNWRPPLGYPKPRPIPNFEIEWIQTPPFKHTSFISHAVPTELPPFEVVPPMAGAEDPLQSTQDIARWVEEVVREHVGEKRAEGPMSEDELEYEKKWVRAVMFNQDSFERVDPMRVRRDYQALKGVMNELGLNAKNLARVPGSSGAFDQRRFNAEDDPELGPKLARASNLLKARLGITLWELQSQAQSFTKHQVIPDPVAIDTCELCGALSCRVHTRFLKAGNIPTAHSARARHSPPKQPDRTDCGVECFKRQENDALVKFHKRKECLQSDLDEYSQYLRERPSIPACVLAKMFKKPCYEIEGIVRQLLGIDGPRFDSSTNKVERIPVAHVRPKPRPIAQTKGYEPCSCRGPCQPVLRKARKGKKRQLEEVEETCDCVANGTYCDRFCGCSEYCARRFLGCECRISPRFVRCAIDKCPCKQADRECDPQLCAKFDGPDEASGANDQIRYKKQKATGVIKSAVEAAGLGVELLEDAKKNDLIGLYGGEMFDPNEPSGILRTKLQLNAPSYWFTVDEHHSIDPIAMGNQMRFINDLGDYNCEPRAVYIDGTHQMGIYATCDLKRGDELSMNYGKGYWEHQRVPRMAGKGFEDSDSSGEEEEDMEMEE